MTIAISGIVRRIWAMTAKCDRWIHLLLCSRIKLLGDVAEIRGT